MGFSETNTDFRDKNSQYGGWNRDFLSSDKNIPFVCGSLTDFTTWLCNGTQNAVFWNTFNKEYF